MMVYIAESHQGHGKIGAFDSLEKAKTALEAKISDGNTDPNQWEGWEWWKDENGHLCFGGDNKTCPEGTVWIHEVQ